MVNLVTRSNFEPDFCDVEEVVENVHWIEIILLRGGFRRKLTQLLKRQLISDERLTLYLIKT